MSQITINLSKYFEFNLELCMRSGQIFGWTKVDKRWYGFLNNIPVRVFQEKDKLIIYSNKKISEDEIIHFFSLDEDIEEINGKIEVNDFMNKAINSYSGLRILRQNPIDTIIEFICAQNKNIPSIEKTIARLSEKYGEKTEIDGITLFKLPNARKIADCSLNGLLETGLGYRAKYLRNSAKKILEDTTYIDRIKKMNYSDALHAMTSGSTKLDGVGLKVADCILLYGFHKLEAFPIDVWVFRAYAMALKEYVNEDLYRENRFGKMKLDKKKYLLMGNFARKIFGKYAGYAQLYIYMASRNLLMSNEKV
ncbi:MAG: DNA glycosylase [Nitrososphaeria archaeon]